MSSTNKSSKSESPAPDYVVFVDGSVDVNKNSAFSHGGAGAVIIKINKDLHRNLMIADEARLRAFFYEGYDAVTNNTMELEAIHHGIDCCQVGSLVDLWADSKYALGSIFDPTWSAGANKNLIRKIKAMIQDQGYVIRHHHIRGHMGFFLNELADLLANKTIERRSNIRHNLEICKGTDLRCWGCKKFPCLSSPDMPADLSKAKAGWKPKFAAIRGIRFTRCIKYEPYVSFSWNGTSGS